MKIVRERDMEYLESLSRVSDPKLKKEATLDAIVRLTKEYGDTYLNMKPTVGYKKFLESIVNSGDLPVNVRIKIT